MKNETKNQEVVALVNAAFDKDGFLIRKGMKARQKAARAFLDGDVSFYGQTVNGYDTHGSLLIIAYPNATI